MSNRHNLSLRLDSLEEEELRILYRRLLQRTTGTEPAEGAELDRELHLFETTDCERGVLLRRLLGVTEVTSEPWLPSPDNLQLGRTLRFRSVPGKNDLSYFSEVGETISANEAEAMLDPANNEGNASLEIAREFSGLPEGWALVAEPPMGPRFSRNVSLPLLWVLVCRSPEAFRSMANRLGDNRPLLVVFDEMGEDTPEHIMDIRCCQIAEAPALLTQFFERTELLIHPDKRQLIRAIVALNESASIILSRKTVEARHHESLRIALDLAEVEWAELFRDERRQGVRDLQLSVVAHPFQKTRLILSSEREAQVSHYLKTQLAPRIRNFIKRQGLELAKVRIDSPDHPLLGREGSYLSDASHLRAGILMALPTLALLTPSMAMEPSKISELIEGSPPPPLASGPEPSGNDSGILEVGDGVPDWVPAAIAAKLAPLLDKGKEWISDVIQKPLEGVEKQLGNIDARLGQLLGILVAGQVAVAIAAAIGTIIMIKGTLSLAQTEAKLHELLDQLEEEWPRIRESLEALIPELEGSSSELLAKRANLIITEINSI